MKTIPLKDSLTQLPVGVLTLKDGEPIVHRNFELGPITGRVRLALGAADLQGNLGRQTTELLTHTLNALGPYPAATRETVRSLTFIDREFLSWLHTIRRLGDQPIELGSPCQFCGVSVTASVPVGNLLVNVLEDEDWELWEVGGAKERTFVFSDGKFGPLRVRMLTGADEEAVAPYRERNPQEATLRDLHRSIVSYKGQALSFDDVLDLSDDTLDWVQAALESLDIGASQRVNVTCQECTRTFKVAYSPFALLATLEVPKVSPPYETRCSS